MTSIELELRSTQRRNLWFSATSNDTADDRSIVAAVTPAYLIFDQELRTVGDTKKTQHLISQYFCWMKVGIWRPCKALLILRAKKTSNSLLKAGMWNFVRKWTITVTTYYVGNIVYKRTNKNMTTKWMFENLSGKFNIYNIYLKQ
jgi:hypothetical protein